LFFHAAFGESCILRKPFELILLLLCASCSPVQPERQRTEGGAVRIVSTAPALTEIVCAVGAAAMLAGRTDACDYPPELVGAIPVAGKFAYPNLEQVIALQPTHLLESFLVDPLKKSALEKFGIRVEHIPCDRMADIPAAIRRIGELTARSAAAQRLAGTIEAELERARAEAAGPMRKYRTLLLFDHNTPVTCGPGTFVSELTALAGARNIAGSLTKEYDTISLEWIVNQNPELIICFFKNGGDPLTLFKKRAGWMEITAVREGRVITPANLDIVCRPGPRVLDGLREMRRVIQLNE